MPLYNSVQQLLSGPKFLTGSFYDYGAFIQPGIRPLLQNGAALTANTIYYFPVPVTQTFTCATLNLRVTTNVAASNFRMGWYTDTNTLLGHYTQPASLVTGSDGGALSGATTGNKQATLTNCVLYAGNWYWLALVTDAALGFHTWNGAGTPDLGRTSAGSSTFMTCYTQSYTFAALPPSASPTLTLTNYPTSSAAPRFEVGI